jgi:hypothetical protein
MLYTAQATNFWDINLSQVLVFPCELCHYLFRLKVILRPVRLLAPPQARTLIFILQNTGDSMLNRVVALGESGLQIVTVKSLLISGNNTMSIRSQTRDAASQTYRHNKSSFQFDPEYFTEDSAY